MSPLIAALVPALVNIFNDRVKAKSTIAGVPVTAGAGAMAIGAVPGVDPSTVEGLIITLLTAAVGLFSLWRKKGGEQFKKELINGLGALMMGVMAMLAVPESAKADPLPSTDGYVTIEWDAPALRANGDLLSAAEIAGYRVYECDSSEPAAVVLAPDLSVKVGADLSGSMSELSLCYQVSTVDTNGVEGSLSDPVNSVFSAPGVVSSVRIVFASSVTVEVR